MSATVPSAFVQTNRRHTTAAAVLVCAELEHGRELRDLLGAAGIRIQAVVGRLEQVAAQDLAADGVIVVDARGGASSVLEELKAVRASAGHALVMIWPKDERRQDKKLLRAGVSAVVAADEVETTLAPAVGAALGGFICVPRQPTGSSGAALLSVRERQVLGMLIMGFSNAEIGQRLYLAESTVKSHLSSAYLKLGVRSRKDAAALILDPDRGLGTRVLAIDGLAD